MKIMVIFFCLIPLALTLFAVQSHAIDKRSLAQGHDAIDAELKRRIPLAEQGGYIPHLDHAVPHDVPYEAFAYYWERKKELLGIS